MNLYLIFMEDYAKLQFIPFVCILSLVSIYHRQTSNGFFYIYHGKIVFSDMSNTNDLKNTLKQLSKLFEIKKKSDVDW